MVEVYGPDWNKIEKRIRKEGTSIALHSTLKRQLEQKFGVLPKSVLERIESADSEQLDFWLDQVIFSETLEEILGKPNGATAS